jgi:hypothetical protein
LHAALASVVAGVRDARPASLAIYGAGEVGRALARQLRSSGLSVECFVDGNQAIVGGQSCGLSIVTLEEALERGCRSFAVGSLGSVDAIRASILEGSGRLGCAVEVFSVDEGSSERREGHARDAA